jgi:hypothetical protein
MAHVPRMGDSRGAYSVLVRNLREIHHFDDLGIRGRIMLKQVFKKCYGEACIGLVCVTIGTDGERLLMR